MGVCTYGVTSCRAIITQMESVNAHRSHTHGASYRVQQVSAPQQQLCNTAHSKTPKKARPSSKKKKKNTDGHAAHMVICVLTIPSPRVSIDFRKKKKKSPSSVFSEWQSAVVVTSGAYRIYYTRAGRYIVIPYPKRERIHRCCSGRRSKIDRRFPDPRRDEFFTAIALVSDIRQ